MKDLLQGKICLKFVYFRKLYKVNIKRLKYSFRSCLESRSSRITKYNADIDAKALDIKEKYAKKLEDIIVKRVEWADKVFKKLYGKVIIWLKFKLSY